MLKLFKNKKSESAQLDVKDLLLDYLSRRVVAEANKAFDQNDHEGNTIEQWRRQHHSYEA